MSDTQWVLGERSLKGIELAKAMDLSPVMGQILINRGISTVAQANAFLYCQEPPSDPYLLQDMDKAIPRIIKALDGGETICVYGDYDVDGQTATALLVYVLQSLAANAEKICYYIPHRMEEGYGLNSSAVAELAKQATLLITVDCGISSHQEAKLAHELGLDLIITDHHEVGDSLPQAVAVINPKRPGSTYPCPNLAGVGVAYKLAEALGSHYGVSVLEHLDLVALGTVADIVSLTGENRFFVRQGLKELANTRKPGLAALCEVSSVNDPSGSDLGYRLGPRLNAVGRMGEPTRGVKLLTTNDQAEAESLAELLDQENHQRQQVEQVILEEAKEMVVSQGLDQGSAIVVASKRWHPGVIGIVGSRLVNLFYRPTVVIALENGEGKGSARSIPGLHLYKAFAQCGDLLKKYGGHAMAAGLSISEDNLSAFSQRFLGYAEANLSPADYVRKITVDASLDLTEVSEDFINQMKLLEPYGMDNPPPVFRVSGALTRYQAIGSDGSHVKGILKSGDKQLEILGFGLRERIEQLEGSREKLELLVDPQINEWRNRRSIQLLIRDIKPGLTGESYIERWMLSYPWKLNPKYRACELEPGKAELPHNHQLKPVDARNTWDKSGYLSRHLAAGNRGLIYVHTPQECLELCRQLRLDYPQYAEMMGFAHSLLTVEERSELQVLLGEDKIKLLITTGLELEEGNWDQLFLWALPLHQKIVNRLVAQLKPQGELHLLYGKEDAKKAQVYLQQSFPDRARLARLYQQFPGQKPAQLSYQQFAALADQAGILPGVDFALAVFADLALIRQSADGIEILPPPDKKLDLHSSVLYNEGMEKCQRLVMSLHRNMERGAS